MNAIDISTNSYQFLLIMLIQSNSINTTQYQLAQSTDFQLGLITHLTLADYWQTQPHSEHRTQTCTHHAECPHCDIMLTHECGAKHCVHITKKADQSFQVKNIKLYLKKYKLHAATTCSYWPINTRG